MKWNTFLHIYDFSFFFSSRPLLFLESQGLKRGPATTELAVADPPVSTKKQSGDGKEKGRAAYF